MTHTLRRGWRLLLAVVVLAALAIGAAAPGRGAG